MYCIWWIIVIARFRIQGAGEEGGGHVQWCPQVSEHRERHVRGLQEDEAALRKVSEEFPELYYNHVIGEYTGNLVWTCSMEQVNSLREIQAMRRLKDHPNILQLIEVLL